MGLESCREYGGATICAHCGFGKSITALRLGYELDGVQMILVDADKLVDQWVEAIHDTIAGARVLAKPTADELRRTKQLQPDNPAMRTVTHVVMTIQSLISKPPNEFEQPFIDFFKHIGVVIADEAHVIPASKFRTCMQLLGYAPYRVALTATPERKDNLHKWIFATFGDIVFRSDPKDFHDGGRVEAIMVPATARPVTQHESDAIKEKYGIEDKRKKKQEQDEGEEKEDVPKTKSGTIMVRRRKAKTSVAPGYSYVTETENIVLSPAANELLVNRLVELMTETPTRCTMVISFYRSHLYVLRDMIRERGFTVFSLFGKERDATDAVLVPGTIVLTSYSQGSKGVNFRNLNTLILASPWSDVLQTIGRILRNPTDMLIVDMVHQHRYSYIKQYNERKKQYAYYGFFFDEEPNNKGKRKSEARKSNTRTKQPRIDFAFSEDMS